MSEKYTVRFDESDDMTDEPEACFKVAHDILLHMSKQRNKTPIDQYEELVRKIASYTSEEINNASASILHIYTEQSLQGEEFDFHTCYSYTLVLSTMVYVLKERTKF